VPRYVAPDGQLVENHGMADNLMMEGGMNRRGWAMLRPETRPDDVWRDLAVYRRVLALIRDTLSV
jgi:hypothetical protein